MSYSNNYQKQGISTIVLFALAGLFFVSLIYEVTSDGVTAAFEWLPTIEWANFAGDTVVNALQMTIFSILAGALGTRYSQGGRNNMGGYRENSNFQPKEGKKQITQKRNTQKPKYTNFGGRVK